MYPLLLLLLLLFIYLFFQLKVCVVQCFCHRKRTVDGEKNPTLPWRAVTSVSRIALRCCVVIFQVTLMDTGVRGTIAVGLVPQFYKLDHQPGWLPHSVAYHADDGKWVFHLGGFCYILKRIEITVINPSEATRARSKVFLNVSLMYVVIRRTRRTNEGQIP